MDSLADWADMRQLHADLCELQPCWKFGQGFLLAQFLFFFTHDNLQKNIDGRPFCCMETAPPRGQLENNLDLMVENVTGYLSVRAGRSCLGLIA